MPIYVFLSADLLISLPSSRVSFISTFRATDDLIARLGMGQIAALHERGTRRMDNGVIAAHCFSHVLNVR